MALVPDRGKRQKNNIEIAYFLYRGLEVFPILIPQFKLAMGIRKARYCLLYTSPSPRDRG